MRLLTLLLVLVAILYFKSGGGAVGFIFGDPIDKLPPHRLADVQPQQEALPEPHVISYKDHTLHLTHRFALQALVLSVEHYFLDKESELSPVDLALGWGPMSSPAPLKMIRITQSGRFYHYRYQNQPPVSKQEIAANSANMHMIPANDSVRRALKKLRRGDVIALEGYLVRATNPKTGWRWNSSLTRMDTGNGACELVYVEDIRIIDPV